MNPSKWDMQQSRSQTPQVGNEANRDEHHNLNVCSLGVC